MTAQPLSRRAPRCTCIADPCECAAILARYSGRAALTPEQQARFAADDARFAEVDRRVGESLEKSRRWIEGGG